MSSIFTKIINKEIQAAIIYEDDLAIAFLDISQATKGHTLVVPKQEAKTILELDLKYASHLLVVVKKVTKIIKERLKPSGFNLISNNGEIAGQSVPHFHIHIIPRYTKDDVKIETTNNSANVTKTSLEVLRLLLKED
ncbi:MAG: HIT family protein [Acholeplasmatales bacterium]|jgi:histidine triad (HIT) family protein|nr:HIT family protein [Acholeplasmatales bacterium]